MSPLLRRPILSPPAGVLTRPQQIAANIAYVVIPPGPTVGIGPNCLATMIRSGPLPKTHWSDSKHE